MRFSTILDLKHAFTIVNTRKNCWWDCSAVICWNNQSWNVIICLWQNWQKNFLFFYLILIHLTSTWFSHHQGSEPWWEDTTWQSLVLRRTLGNEKIKKNEETPGTDVPAWDSLTWSFATECISISVPVFRQPASPWTCPAAPVCHAVRVETNQFRQSWPPVLRYRVGTKKTFRRRERINQ